MATTKRIVIVEDTAPIAEALHLKLKAMGYDPIICEDGEIAVAEIKKQKPDLVITDIIMPKIDGFGVVAEAKKAHPDVAIVVFSDLAQEEDRVRMVALGVKDYVVKSTTSLADAVKKFDIYAKGGTPPVATSQAPAPKEPVLKPMAPKIEEKHTEPVHKEIKPVEIKHPDHGDAKSITLKHTPTSSVSHSPVHPPKMEPLVVPKPPHASGAHHAGKK